MCLYAKRGLDVIREFVYEGVFVCEGGYVCVIGVFVSERGGVCK